jgi:hypothetical protein
MITAPILSSVSLILLGLALASAVFCSARARSFALQTRVFGYTDDIADIVPVAPAQQLPATESTDTAEDNLYIWPMAAQGLHQQGEDRPAVPGGIDIAGTQVTDQQVATTEHVQWQVAVTYRKTRQTQLTSNI